MTEAEPAPAAPPRSPGTARSPQIVATRAPPSSLSSATRARRASASPEFRPGLHVVEPPELGLGLGPLGLLGSGSEELCAQRRAELPASARSLIAKSTSHTNLAAVASGMTPVLASGGAPAVAAPREVLFPVPGPPSRTGESCRSSTFDSHRSTMSSTASLSVPPTRPGTAETGLVRGRSRSFSSGAAPAPPVPSGCFVNALSIGVPAQGQQQGQGLQQRAIPTLSAVEREQPESLPALSGTIAGGSPVGGGLCEGALGQARASPRLLALAAEGGALGLGGTRPRSGSEARTLGARRPSSAQPQRPTGLLPVTVMQQLL
eukprot:m51a1_g7992 hypothetical protein (319) ;mRNA; f:103130-104546